MKAHSLKSDFYLFENLLYFAFYFSKLFHLQSEPKHCYVCNLIPTCGIYFDLISVLLIEDYGQVVMEFWTVVFGLWS